MSEQWNPRWNYHLGGEPRSTCACPDGAYEGARPATWPRWCERCGGLVTPEPSSLSAEDTALVAEVLESHMLTWEPHEFCCTCREWQSAAITDEDAQEGHRRHLLAALAPVLAQIRADERRRAGEREAALRERVEAVAVGWEREAMEAKDPCPDGLCGACTMGNVSQILRAALAADEPEAAEGGAERERACPVDPHARPCAGGKHYCCTTPPGQDESPEAGAREDA